MDSLLTAIILVEIIATLSLGALVLSQDSKNMVNKSFFLMSLFAAAWIPLAYFGGNIDDIAISEQIIRADYVLGILLIWSFWLLTDVYRRSLANNANKQNKGKVIRVVSLVVVFIVSLSTLSSAVINYSVIDGQLIVNEETPFMFTYTVPAILLILFGGWNLYMARKTAPPDERTRANLISISLIGTLLVVAVPFLLADTLLGESFNTDVLQQIVIIGFVLFIGLTAYAILKHRLFDVRATISRSVTYVLALMAMLAIYAGLVFGATLIFFDPEDIHPEQFIVFALLAVFLVFTYQPLKKFFDRFTDEVFYRQSYDSEELLNEYSDYLVDEVDTEKIVGHTLDLIDNSLNPETVHIVLYLEGKGKWYNSSGPIPSDGRDALAKALEYQKSPIMVSDLSGIREDEFIRNIKDHLSREGIRLSVKLSTHGQLEGYILLGDRKNGSRFSPDDHNFLTTVANELSVSLQNSERFDEIQRFNETLKEQIEAATQQLRESNKKLQSLDQAKDEFISMASHQLRTPLTSVKGYVSMMMDGDAGPITDEQKGLLSEAFASSQRMVYLISDLLNVSRLKTGKFIIERTVVDLPKMVAQEVSQLVPAAETRNLVLSYAPPARFPELMLDETKIRQVIMNFIDNAIYYTKSGGQIEVNLRVNKNQVEYRVKDTGIGVPTRDQHKLFTKFFRARNARSARPDGTGLGLYMAQKIITAQGGTIHFLSKEDKGSEFGFNLPLTDEATIQKSSK